jgi:NADPH-dependent 2,4-dienoyl-CoA reductase/sulfur reductase-like enzyme
MVPHTQAHCDLLIIGAGPAGLAAALAAAPSGASITLIDDNPAPGGQIWRDGPGVKLPAAALQRREAVTRLHNVRVLSAARVVALPQPGCVLLEEAHQSCTVHYQKLILCTGARELLLPFPGWTLPGVTGAGGLQALIKGGLPVRGERIVVAGSGPLLLAVAATAKAAGAQVVRVAEQAPLRSVAAFATSLVRWPGKALQALALMHPGYRTGSYVLEALGPTHLASVRLQQGARVQDIACDRLACGFGLIPNTELAQALGCTLTPQRAIAVDSWQNTSIPGLFAAGECTGFGGSERALVQGSIAGHAAVEALSQAQKLWPERERWARFASSLAQHFALQPALKNLARPDTQVCRCEDVTHADLQELPSWTEAKLSTRCGMGACQGRICGAATQFMFDWTPPTPRTPLSPARIETLLHGADAPMD